jgi:hypothetical protein
LQWHKPEGTEEEGTVVEVAGMAEVEGVMAGTAVTEVITAVTEVIMVVTEVITVVTEGIMVAGVGQRLLLVLASAIRITDTTVILMAITAILLTRMLPLRPRTFDQHQFIKRRRPTAQLHRLRLLPRPRFMFTLNEQ